MPGVYKRGARWGVYYYDATGRRVRRIVGTKPEAQRELGRLLAGQAHGVAPATATLADLRALWWEANEGAERLRHDSARWDRLQRVLGGARRRLSTLTPGQVDRALRALQSEPSAKGGTLSNSSVNWHLAVLRSACQLAVRHGLLSHDPTAGARRLPVHDERDRILSEDEERRLLELARPRDAEVVLLAVETGMRAGEIRRLTWDRVDLGRRIVRLRAEHTKTRRARVVPLSLRAVEALRAARERHPDSSTVLCPVPTQAALSGRFAYLVRRAGIEDLRFHDLRHTAATRMRRRGVDPITIMRICGWRSPASLLRYQSVDHAELLAAVDAPTT